MLINLEGPPLKSLLCEMGGATDAGQPRGTTPEGLLTFLLAFQNSKIKKILSNYQIN